MTPSKRSLSVITLIVVALALTPAIASAQFESLEEAGLNPGGTPRGSDLKGAIAGLINVALSLIAIIALAFLIFGGFKYIVAHGDEQKLTAAKSTVLYSLVGLVIVGLAAVIINFVIDALPN